MKELKEALKFALALGNGIAKAYEDKVLDLSDISSLWEPLTHVTDAVEGSEKILAEIRSLDKEKLADLVLWVKGEFDIADDEIEKKVEAALDILVGIFGFLKTVIK
jgi:hypothetical protein